MLVQRRLRDAPADAWLRLVAYHSLPRFEAGDVRAGLDREAVAALLAACARSRGPLFWPRAQYGLAILWREFPDQRADNPLPDIYPRWVDALEARPDLLAGSGGKGGRRDASPTDYAYAIAVVHLGAAALGIQRPDGLLVRLRARLAALADEAGVSPGSDIPFRRYRDPRPLEVVIAQGQVAALLGDREGLRAAQQFIMPMLARGDHRARSAYEIYEETSISTRAGLLAVLRGIPALFAPPPIRR